MQDVSVQNHGLAGIQSVKIARAVLADGRALVGLNLSPSDVPNVKQRLGIGTPLAEASADEVLALLEGGGVIELDNGWWLTRSRLAGDEIVQLVSTCIIQRMMISGVSGTRFVFSTRRGGRSGCRRR